MMPLDLLLSDKHAQFLDKQEKEKAALENGYAGKPEFMTLKALQQIMAPLNKAIDKARIAACAYEDFNEVRAYYNCASGIPEIEAYSLAPDYELVLTKQEVEAKGYIAPDDLDLIARLQENEAERGRA